MSPKILIFSVLVAFCYGKIVNVRNTHPTALVVSGGDVDYTVAPGGFVVLTPADEWSGTITAVPVGSEVTDGPKTKVVMSLSAAGDSYSVNLEEGFNLGAKVVPTGSTNCSAALCYVNLLRRCPLANQVTNSLGAVIACHNSPLIMSTMCPLAVVKDATPINVKYCADATSYLVMFN